MTYEEWIKEEARKINSDGCTLAAEWNQWCCFEHDVACRLNKDPRVAYEVGWDLAPPMSRRDADKRFWRCNRKNQSLWGRFRADLRYLGVRLGDILPGI